MPGEKVEVKISREAYEKARKLAEEAGFSSVEELIEFLIEEAAARARLEDRLPVYEKIQSCMDANALIVPLFASHRITVTRDDVPPLTFGGDLYRLDAPLFFPAQ